MNSILTLHESDPDLDLNLDIDVLSESDCTPSAHSNENIIDPVELLDNDISQAEVFSGDRSTTSNQDRVQPEHSGNSLVNSTHAGPVFTNTQPFQLVDSFLDDQSKVERVEGN